MQTRSRQRVPALAMLLLAATTVIFGQGPVTPPKFGEYTAGDDYFLANYTQLLDHWSKATPWHFQIPLQRHRSRRRGSGKIAIIHSLGRGDLT
jgi:hypothetical protein